MTSPGKMNPRYICHRGLQIDRNKNYILRFALSGRDLHKGSIKVRILQYGAKKGKKSPVLGWAAPNRPGVHDLIPDLHGTFDWKVFEIKLSGASFNPKTQTAAVFFQHLKPGLGELKIDAVSFEAVK